MIIKILYKPSPSFGIAYNFKKVDRNTGELMRLANFGVLQGTYQPRPQDLTNYLRMLAARNPAISKPQFHAVLSAREDMYDKQELAGVAEKWLQEMGYGDQPYVIIAHQDTDNNHVHLVSCRVDRDGRQIPRDFEKVRSVRSLEKILGYTDALCYNFSTKAQFYLIIESKGQLGRDYLDEARLLKKLNAYRPDQTRINYLRTLFRKHAADPDFKDKMLQEHHIDIIFHTSEGRQPYGYTVIDHAAKQVFKGSEIIRLKDLYNAGMRSVSDTPSSATSVTPHAAPTTRLVPETDNAWIAEGSTPGIWIADDIDDEGILGRNRRRKQKSRTNTR